MGHEGERLGKGRGKEHVQCLLHLGFWLERLLRGVEVLKGLKPNGP